MKRHIVTFAWACATCVAVFLAFVVATYIIWYVQSWDYNHSPRLSDSDPHDAAAMMLVAMEVIFGAPAGLLFGVVAGAIVIVARQRRSASSD